jgi:hypothetical protein
VISRKEELDLDWGDKLGFRGKEDVESPLGQWARVEVVCDRVTITNIVNGQVVNEAARSNLTSGKIVFQSKVPKSFFVASTWSCCQNRNDVFGGRVHVTAERD